MSCKDRSGRNRGYGKPKDRDSYSVAKCDVRLSLEEDKMLQELADRNGVTRSEIMRKALKDFHKFNSVEE